MDAFSHAAESYVNNMSNFLTEPFALQAIEFISHHLEKATVNGKNIEARTYMSAGSLMAGMAFSQTGTGLAHALAETIQIPFKIPHGAAIGTILPHVVAFNVKAKPTKYAKIASMMGLDIIGLSETELSEKLKNRIREINRRIGIPNVLSAYGILETDLKKIAKSTAIHQKGYLKKNPQMANEKDLVQILKNAFYN
jgi:alcohol dehydrogenase class IV